MHLLISYIGYRATVDESIILNTDMCITSPAYFPPVNIFLETKYNTVTVHVHEGSTM